jgi:hemoglobin
MNQSKPEPSLFDKIGGRDAVAGMVGRFYRRVLEDPELAPYFRGVSMDKLRRIAYSGRSVIHAHQHLRITRPHLQAFVQHLFETLAEYPLTEKDRYDVIARINTYTDEVVSAGTGLGG